MKYCPNPECPFLDAVGTIAEYEDRVDVCPECDAELSDGAAPSRLPAHVQADVAALQSVATVGSEDEAIWIQDELEQMRIAAQIVETDPESVDPALVIDPDLPLFDVRVLAHHVVPAMTVLNVLLSDDEPDNEFDHEFDDEFDDDEFEDDKSDLDELDAFDGLDQAKPAGNEQDFGESDSAEVVGMGNNFLLFFMVALVVLVLAALIYGFTSLG